MFTVKGLYSMCGRYSITKTIKEIVSKYNLEFIEENYNYQPNYNAVPSSELPIITNTEKLKLQFFQWGLIPVWANDKKIAHKLNNARSETIFEKPSFRDSIKFKRCLIISDGYYEWKKENSHKIPYRITVKDNSLFSMAGVWAEWRDPLSKDKVFSFTIVTQDANDSLKEVHHRMPIILNKDTENIWLKSNFDRSNLELVKGLSNKTEFNSFEVSTKVNSPKNNNPELLLAV